MKTDLERLNELVDLERQAESSAEATERGWRRLAAAVGQGKTGVLSLGTSKTLQVLAAWYAGKWVVGGALGLALAGMSWPVVAPRVASPPRRASMALMPSSGQIGGAVRPRVSPSGEPRADEVIPPVQAIPVERGHRAGSAGTAAPSRAFEQELTLIKTAKAELDAGRTAAGLALLNEHARLYAQGVFAGEREALRALGQCAVRGSAAGRKFGAAFIRAYPDSPMVDRVRHACGLPELPR